MQTKLCGLLFLTVVAIDAAAVPPEPLQRRALRGGGGGGRRNRNKGLGGEAQASESGDAVAVSARYARSPAPLPPTCVSCLDFRSCLLLSSLHFLRARFRLLLLVRSCS